MIGDKRRDLILKVIPERKRTTKKLKIDALQEIYFRGSSLPQKKSTQVRQTDNSLPKKQLDARDNYASNPINENSKFQQESQSWQNRIVQRKNKSLPKYLMTETSQFQNQFDSNTANNERTKTKKFSYKEHKQLVNSSQQKYRLQALNEIMKKKDSKRLIRQSLLGNNFRQSPMQISQPHRPKHKDSKMVNLKQAFENRKFTNLTKYKVSVGSKSNLDSLQNRLQLQKDAGRSSNKISNQISKKKLKTQYDQLYESDTIRQNEQAYKKQVIHIKDLDLTQCIDSQNSLKKKQGNVCTLQDVYLRATMIIQAFQDKKQKKINCSSSSLNQALKLLKQIEKQTGTMSRKTMLMLGKVSYYLQKYNDCIFTIQSVFQQCQYDLSCIQSLRNIGKTIDRVEIYHFYQKFFFILAESYKKTQNFLCTIKVLNQWEKNIVEKCIYQDLQIKKPQLKDEKRKRVVSSLNKYEDEKSDEVNNSKKHLQGYETKWTIPSKVQKAASNADLRKQSHPIFRQTSSGASKTYFSSTNKQIQRAQSLTHKQSFKHKTQNLNLKARQRNFSIKTLSEINVNLQNYEACHHSNSDEKLKNFAQKKIFLLGFLQRARTNFQIKNFYAAIKDYEKTLICNQFHLEAGLQLCTLYYKIGRKQKALSFLEEFLQKTLNCEFKQSRDVNMIRYHLLIMLYKCGKYQQSFKVIQDMELQTKYEENRGQIYFYLALNLIKLKKIFTSNLNEDDKQKNQEIEQIMLYLQKSIDFGTSKFYIFSAYFLRIYLLLFKIKHYYGAQYQIDRMNSLLDKDRFLKDKKKEMQNNNKTNSNIIDFKKISIQPLHHILNLNYLIQFVFGIISILKLQLSKGISLISQVETKVKTNKQNLISSEILAIESMNLTDRNQNQTQIHINEILKLLYQFKYYGLYVMRSYRKAIGYLEKIKEIDAQSYIKFGQESNYKAEERQSIQIKFDIFKEEGDKVNYLILRSLILIEDNKFQEAMKMLKLVQIQSARKKSTRQNGSKRQKSLKSGKNDTIESVAAQYKKSQSSFYTIKALCYILLYKYLEKTKQKQSPFQTLQQKQQIKIQQNSSNSKIQPSQIDLHQQNNQILLAAQQLLSQCLIFDHENFEVLFLVAVIHYQLKRYESSLNYIRQAIELSDDHMIKHYYLKANMKLLMGKYQDAVKDYSNAITVFKQFEKDKVQGSKSTDLQEENQSYETISQIAPMAQSRNQIYETFPHQTITITDQITVANTNEYYEQEQQMYPQIYLNRAISYLKYAYGLQHESCFENKYEECRENIINLKSAASQDIRQYFTQLFNLMKKSQNIKVKNTIQSQKSSKTQIKNKNMNRTLHIEDLRSDIVEKGKYLQLLLHTSQVQPLLETSRQFAKEFNIKLVTDEELMVYFYIAKQLNNCLLLMQKIIKKYYLPDRNNQTSKNSKSLTKKPNSSCHAQSQDQEPYFKSKRDKKSSYAERFPQYNSQKYNQPSSSPKQFSSPSSKQKVSKLIIDKKILSSLKQSSSNSREDYESALINFLEEEQSIKKAGLTGDRDNMVELQAGNIFKYADLLFFIGVIYFRLEDYYTSVTYFEQSYQLKQKRQELLSIKSIVAVSSLSNDMEHLSEEQRQFVQQISFANLKNFEEIYDNRIYSKEEIEYNLGVAYLLLGDYNLAYDYLETYPDFVEIIEQNLGSDSIQNSTDDKKTKNKLKKLKTHIKDSELFHTEALNDSFDQISVKTKENKDQKEGQSYDITPFPTHNRLCSIYPQKQLNGKKFSLSFCLPKISLPHLGFFYQEQIQIGQPCHNRNISQKQSNLNIIDTKELLPLPKKKKSSPDKKKSISLDQQAKFVIKKENLVNYLDIINLKDIEMKPIAPWIKKDKQKRCIKFTQNFLSESFDLKTQSVTQRKGRTSSKKQMFAEISNQKPTNLKNQEGNQIKYNHHKKGQLKQQQTNKQTKTKNRRLEQRDVPKIKQKQKPQKNRYETIDID